MRALVVPILALGACLAQAADSVPVPRVQLNGTWDRYRDPRAAGSRIDPRFTSGLQIPAPPLKPQYVAAWHERQREIREADARGQPLFSGYAQCLPDGMPAMMMAMFPMEVLESPGQVTIIEEAYNQVRRIYLDEKQMSIDDAEPGFWGHSVGHWEGDTLIVNTVGIKERVQLDNVPHSDQMQIDERIRLTSPDSFEDRITVTDPVYLSAPWTWTWTYKRRPHYKIMEYVCEANREYQDPNTGGTRLAPLPPPPANPPN